MENLNYLHLKFKISYNIILNIISEYIQEDCYNVNKKVIEYVLKTV